MKQCPQILFYLTVAFLGLSYALIVAIDVFNLFDLHTTFIAANDRWYFWLFWFHNPVEAPIQWVGLATVALVSLITARNAYQAEQSDQFRFSLLFSIAVILMFVEDSLNPRHHLRLYLESQDEVGYGMMGTLVELGYFAVLGGLLLFVFFRYRHVFWEHKRARQFLIAGYVFYAIAVGSSWLGSAFRSTTDSFVDLYTVVGGFFTRLLFFDGAEREAYFHAINEHFAKTDRLPLEYWFMDYVWEESLELLGVSALLVATLVLFYDAGEDTSES